MLDSVKISRRQSEIRQELAVLAGKSEPTADETAAMETLDAEYRTNETRYRAALIAEDQERKDAGADLETRGAREWADLVDRFELRQVALYLDEGRAIDGATAEVVTELRNAGGYRGVPVPWEALELRAGETVAAGVPDPLRTAPVIDRLFADSVAGRMGGSFVNIDQGFVDYPVATDGATVGWQTTETGSVGAANAYDTVDRPLRPDHTLGVQMKLTRRSLKQAGAALEQAVRRDMNGAMAQEMDRVVFLGSGASGEPTGLITEANTSGSDIGSASLDAEPTWAAFRLVVTTFMVTNAASSPSAVRLLVRPEVWDVMDELISGLEISEWERMLRNIPASNIVMSSNALADPTGSPVAVSAVLTTRKDGVPPFFVGTWGAIDMIRDPYSDAASGGLRLTALATMDVTFSRGAQIEVLNGIQVV